MLIRIAVAVYLAWSILLIAQQPGLQYDEALLVSDAVYMLHFRGVTTQPHDPHTWVCAGKRCFPLMTTRYVGPMKAFLCLPLFKIFGANAEIIRIVSMLLGAIGVWGLAALIAYLAGNWAGGMAGLALAVHPTYLNMTVFDNNAIAAMMAALGLLCLAIRAYLRRPTVAAALGIGAAMGLGIWARANYLWLPLALAVATFLVARPSIRKLSWAIVGGVLAGLPFLVYQALSRGGTWEGLDMFVEHGGLWDRMQIRWYLLTELLWTARENRAMWAGPDLEQWQRWLSCLIVLGAIAIALWMGSKAARIAALTFLLLLIIMLPSRLQLSEHHLILLLPIAIAVTVLAAASFPTRWLWGAVAAVFFVSCFYWDVSTVRGLAKTGGVGMWSDAIYDLNDDLESKYQDRPIQVLDWGLGENLFVLSQGRLRVAELYGRPVDWNSRIRQGGVFLTTPPNDQHFKEASQAFLSALKQIAPSTPIYGMEQKSGALFAEVINVTPR